MLSSAPGQARHVRMVFKIKGRLVSIAEAHVHHVQLVMMASKTRVRLVSIVVDHVRHVRHLHHHPEMKPYSLPLTLRLAGIAG